MPGLFQADRLQLSGELSEAFVDDAGLEFEVPTLHTAGRGLALQPLDRLFVLFAHGLEGAALAFDGGQPATRFGDGANRRLAACRRLLKVPFDAGERLAAFIAARHEGRRRLTPLGHEALVAFPFAGDIRPAPADGVHLAAQAVKAAALALKLAAGAIEILADRVVARFGLAQFGLEPRDGLAALFELVPRKLGAGAQLADPPGQLFDLPLADERAFVGARRSAGKDAGGLDVDTVEGDDAAEPAADDALGGSGVLDHDHFAEKGIDEPTNLGLGAHQLRRHADDSALLLEVQGEALADGVEGDEVGAPVATFKEQLDRLEGRLFRFDDDGVKPVLEGGVDRDFKARRDAQLAGEEPDDAVDLRRFAEAARLDAFDQGLAHDEDVAGAGGDPVVFGLDAPERIETAFHVVKLAEVLAGGDLVVADLLLDAGMPGAGVFGRQPRPVEEILRFHQLFADTREPTAVGLQLGEQVGPLRPERIRLASELGKP